MSGTKGHSGGRNRLSAAEHLARGTYRADRHGPREAIPFPTAAPTPEPEAIPAEVTAGLGDAGRAFVLELWADYAFTSAAHRALLRLAAQQVDRLEEARVKLAGAKVYADLQGRPHQSPWLRIEARATKTLLEVLKQMDLERGGE